MSVVQIIDANTDQAIAQASVLLRLAGFTTPADDLDAYGINPYEVVMIALDDVGLPVGMVEGRRPASVEDDGVERVSALLTYLAVDPAHRREGVGSELVAAFCDRSRAAGADHVVLQIGTATGERAAGLAAFYLANEFAPTAQGFRRELG